MPRLLDRDAEVAALTDLFTGIQHGEGKVAVVTGEPGAGKTALLDEFCARTAAAGATTLRARGGEFESDLPLGVVRQLFAGVLATLAAGARARVLSGVAARAVDALHHDGPPIPEAELFHALHWVCTNLSAEGPLVMAIDDAQFADVVSLRWLRYVAARIDHLPVLLVLATEPG